MINIFFFSDVKSSLKVLKQSASINAISNINLRKRANFIPTFDFSTNYTNRNHNKPKLVLQKLINFCFK